MQKALFAATAAIALAVGGQAAAQNYSLAPTFGSTNLAANFQPDPHRVSLTAGGNIDVSTRVSGCLGFVADAPQDTTLVINAPDGSWYCDDDTRGLDPVVQFPNPMSGQYDIWVGTWSNSSFPSAVLNISEIGY